MFKFHLLVLQPLKQSNADREMTKETLARNHEIVVT